LALLDEELIRPTGNDKSFCRKACAKNKSHSNFEKSRFSDVEFTIRHFAGDVSYCALGFLDKNRDRLQDNLLTCIQKSDNFFVKNTLFVAKETLTEIGGVGGVGGGGKSTQRHTIATSKAPRGSSRRNTSRANRTASSIVSQLRYVTRCCGRG